MNKEKQIQRKSNRIIKKRHQRKRLDLSLPHVRVAGVIACLTVITLIGSVSLTLLKETFWSSILANIFAGLLTGLVLCLVSGTKQRTVADLKNKLKFLRELHEMILDYFKSHGKVMSASFDKLGGTNELWDLIYDAASHANWVNSFISQGKFKATLSFEPCAYCKEEFDYDAVAMIEVFEELHEYVQDVGNLTSKQEVLARFRVVDNPLRSLNGAVIKAIDAIELKLESIEHTIF